MGTLIREQADELPGVHHHYHHTPAWIVIAFSFLSGAILSLSVASAVFHRRLAKIENSLVRIEHLLVPK